MMEMGGKKGLKQRWSQHLGIYNQQMSSESLLGIPWAMGIQQRVKDKSPRPHEVSDWQKQQKIGSKPKEGSLITTGDK